MVIAFGLADHWCPSLHYLLGTREEGGRPRPAPLLQLHVPWVTKDFHGQGKRLGGG